MADPLTALGAAAAATQFIAYGIKISQALYMIYGKTEGTSAIVKEQKQRIEDMIAIVSMVEKNPALQADTQISSILNSCLIRAKDIQARLERVSLAEKDGRMRKLQKNMSAVFNEKETTAILEDLERWKASLIMRMESIDVELSHKMATDVTVIASTVSNVYENTDRIRQDLGLLSLKLSDHQPPPMPHNPHSKHYFLVPNRRVRDFVGRQGIIARIEAGFSTETSPRIVVLRAMGGQGKTQVALEYCHRAKAKGIQAILWADATSESTLRKSFQDFAEKLKPPGMILEQNAAVDLVKEKLEDWPHTWILVFDNYDDPRSFNNVDDYIPQAKHGCVLFTSRHADTNDLAVANNVIELPGLSVGSALELLLKQSHIQNSDAAQLEGSKIVERLGYHALAITQAGSYIRRQKLQLRDFMSHYDHQRKAVLQQTHQMTQYRRKLNDEDKETALNVFTTWELSFRHLQPQQADLLTLFAFFNGKDISEELFEKFLANPISKAEERLKTNQALLLLLDLDGKLDEHKFGEHIINFYEIALLQSWSQEPDGYRHFSFHPLVQDWILLRTDRDAFLESLLISATILKETLEVSYSYYHFELPLPFKHSLLSHVEMYQKSAANLDYHTGITLQFWRELNFCEHWFARLFEALGFANSFAEMIRKVFEWRENKLGIEHMDTVLLFYDLCNSLAHTEDYIEMEKVARRWINISEKLHGNDEKTTFMAYAELGSALSRLWRCEEAEYIYNTKLKPYESIFGPEDRTVLEVKHKHAINLEFLGRLKEATRIYREILDVDRIIIGDKHPQYLATAYCLGDVLADQKLYEESECILLRVFEQTKRVLGLAHTGTLETATKLAAILLKRSKLGEAEELSKFVMQQRQHVLRPNHPDTLVAEQDYAFALQKNHKYLEGEEVYKDVFMRVKNLRVEHKDTFDTLRTLIKQLCSQENYAKGEDMYRSVLGDWKTNLQDMNLTKANALHELGYIYVCQKRYEEAEVILKKVFETKKNILGIADMSTVNSLSLLGYCHTGLSKYHEAEDADRICLQQREKAYGLEAERTMWSVRNLANDLNNQGKYEESASLYARYLSGWRELYGESDSDYIEYSEMYENMKKRWAREEARSFAQLDLESIFSSWWMNKTLHSDANCV